MFFLYTLIGMLLLLTVLSYYLSNKDILSTSVTLCMSFLGVCCMAAAYADVWLLVLSPMTALVILIGIFSFLCGYYILLFYRKYVQNDNDNINYFEDEIHVNKLATAIFIVLEIVSVYGSYNYVDNVSSLFLQTDNLIEKVGMFHIVVMDQEITNKIDLPSKGRLYTWLEDLCCAGAYIYMYIMAHDYVYKNKIKWYFLLIVILYLFNSLLTGGRFNTVATFMSMVIFFYIFNKRKNKWQMDFSLKKLFKYGFLLIILLLFFPMSMILLGRSNMEVSIDTIGVVFEQIMYDLAVYVGAEIKLLDIFVNETYINITYNDPIGSHTLSGLYGFIARTFDIIEWQGISIGDIPFASVNGYFLGNVYTMFRAYMTDGGILGVIVFSFIMGSIFAFFYFNIRYQNGNGCNNKIDINLIIYGWMYYCVPLSFFSNWFYPLIAPSLIRLLISFLICRAFIVKKDRGEKNKVSF